MADDIVPRLRRCGAWIVNGEWASSRIAADAADEIVRLRGLIDEWYSASESPLYRSPDEMTFYAAADRLEAAEDALIKEARAVTPDPLTLASIEQSGGFPWTTRSVATAPCGCWHRQYTRRYGLCPYHEGYDDGVEAALNLNIKEQQ